MSDRKAKQKIEQAPALERLAALRAEAGEAVAAAGEAGALEELRVRLVGRKSELTAILRGVGELPDSERRAVGQAANAVRAEVERLLEARRAALEGAATSDEALAAGRVDVTLPGVPAVGVGHLHLLTSTRREIEDVFVGLGYRVMEGPEVEWDHYNFTALNHPPGHPARMLQDTFYVEGDEGPQGPPLLRTHTSPMQIRAMEDHEPPLYLIVPGKVYRRDHDATHTPMFHQIEGLAVDEGLTLADLKGTLRELARAIFGPEREVRLRPHFFPFTEPSVEVDVSCFRSGGSGLLPDGSRDPLCKGVGWIEVLGAGMVDPNVFGFVADRGYDPERVQGFAFGMGIERIAMLKHGVGDLRLFFENDVRFLEQFG